MPSILKKSLNQPEETKTPEKFKDESVTINDSKIHKITVYPGWQWSKHLKPVVGGKSCQINHLLYMLSGTMHVKLTDGKEEVLRAGDVVNIPSGHDGWNDGNEPAVWLEIPH